MYVVVYYTCVLILQNPQELGSGDAFQNSPDILTEYFEMMVTATQPKKKMRNSTDAQRFLLRFPSLLVNDVWRALVPALEQ